MIIIVDTREQLPYLSGCECARACLIAGDYTTVVLFNRFHIERKSPQDLYGTITKGNLRFKNELLRAHNREIALAVYVESSKKDFIAKNFRRGGILKFPSTGLAKLIATFESKYFVEFVWCRDRDSAKQMVIKRLRREEKKWKLR